MSGVERENEFKSKLRFSPVFKLFYDARCASWHWSEAALC